MISPVQQPLQQRFGPVPALTNGPPVRWRQAVAAELLLARNRTGGVALAMTAALGMKPLVPDLRPKEKPAGLRRVTCSTSARHPLCNKTSTGCDGAAGQTRRKADDQSQD